MKTLTRFLGWCTVLNLGVLVLTVLAWTIRNDVIVDLWAPLFGITEAELKEAFVRVLLQYRAGIVLFNLVPWVVLKIMARDPGA